MSNLGPPPLSSRAPSELLDNAWAREQFPALEQEVEGRSAIYFDNPAGTQVARRVIERMTSYLLHSNANTHGAFVTSQRTDALIMRARALVAGFLGAESPSEIAFGANMTTLTYALSRAIGRTFAPGDEVIVTDLDHDANISPWLDLEERGIVVRRIPLIRHDATLDLEHYERLLSPRTKLVAVGHASNALGTINDVASIAARAHSVGARVWVDAVHYAPHGPIDVRALGADFLVCSAYKFFGPHLGILWGRSELLAELRVQQVRPAPRSSPEKLETGTKNHEGLAGLIGALEYLAELGGASDVARCDDLAAPLARAMRSIRAYESSLAALLLDGLKSLRGLQLYGLAASADLDRRVPTFSFTLDGVASAEVSRQLAEQGIFSWAGNHYAMTLMERLGLEAQGGVVRVGAVHYNNAAEVQRLLQALDAIRR
jgi:cysteine desulfurase family protein (TIGR01976 family)